MCSVNKPKYKSVTGLNYNIMADNHYIAHDVSGVLKEEYQSGDVNEIQINCANDQKIMVRVIRVTRLVFSIAYLTSQYYKIFRHTNTYLDLSQNIFE